MLIRNELSGNQKVILLIEVVSCFDWKTMLDYLQAT